VKRVFPFVSVLAVAVGLCLRTPAQTGIGVTPGWLRYLGPGGNPYSCSSGTCHLADEHWLSSFNVSAGATLAVGSTFSPLIIRSTGSCTVAGTIANNPKVGGGIVLHGDFGGGGGGGGAGEFRNGNQGWVGLGNGSEITGGGRGGVAPAGSGGNGESTNPGQYHLLLSAGSFWPGGGSVGGSGGSTAGGQGGDGGAIVILVCESMNFTGTIDVSGGAGSAPTANNGGAGGGGGGGYVILSASTWVANTGTINTTGGVGGSCAGFTGCGAGGNGGNGWSMAITIE